MPPAKTDLLQGSLDLLILKALTLGPLHGWGISKRIRQMSRDVLEVNQGSLYPALHRLEDRGLLDETLVVCMGEMGRTPKANTNWGRNHWSTLFPAVLAGAGIRGGSLYGETDADAAYAVTPPTSPEDLAATIYHALGIDPEWRVNDPQGRPVPIVSDGRPLLDLFG